MFYVGISRKGIYSQNGGTKTARRKLQRLRKAKPTKIFSQLGKDILLMGYNTFFTVGKYSNALAIGMKTAQLEYGTQNSLR